ncbi:2,3-diphosphoglycerate-dependent phosphoglycerate mutase [Parvularcula dongshanensis]|uniref:2,3-bisphosphoglycerate-dependent phosphoglycerate mutase n=1 Tax=Parvularcula dongshanensis TaxID=1173995 RepID=A0A840HYY4_9PROT|nr:2,3-diphosphoglycerate-dependent phosphoglycerate mutase [Parvularcula dongshanensis]MBB4657647.1 2,3-bisphosphoglycerate-dependent phosphoglycerate mutase [Parvularcula dongshanensis]
MPTLAFLRHGQSQWNLENRFTGWMDVDLTEKGEAEARRAGELLKESGAEFDACFTSVQTRAIRTLNLALEEMGESWLPVTKDWRLNERHYGGLTGLDKAETAAKHGEEQVHIWRRSFDVPPPELDDPERFPSLSDRRYAGVTTPKTESLKLTLERVEPYWTAEIRPHLEQGQNLIIAAHGNSLRALVKLLFGVADEDIPGVEIPTGNPLLIELDDQIRVTGARYLDDSRAQPLPTVG